MGIYVEWEEAAVIEPRKRIDIAARLRYWANSGPPSLLEEVRVVCREAYREIERLRELLDKASDGLVEGDARCPFCCNGKGEHDEECEFAPRKLGRKKVRR